MPFKQAREATKFTIPILLATLDHHGAGGIRHDDFACTVSRGPQHPHCMVMRQHKMADRFVGHRTDAIDHLARKARGGLRLDHHHAVIPDDHPGIRIALGRKGIKPRPHLGKAGLLFRKIALRCKCLGHIYVLLFTLPNRVGPRRAKAGLHNRQTRCDSRRQAPRRAG